MDKRERRVAQIVRDFIEAYALSEEVGESLQRGSLDFSTVERLVGEADESALYRLKEECHTLFRSDAQRSRTELQADQLFDLAVGALFHEAMKFRECFYLTTAYGPRFARTLAEGAAPAALAESFRRMFEAGQRRMLESQAETAQLFRETRDQLLILLHQLPRSGVLARSLVDDPRRSQAVFGAPIESLLRDIYGSPLAGYSIAIDHLIEHGHYDEAASLLSRPEVRAFGECEVAIQFTRGMALYYANNPEAALDALSAWVRGGAQGRPIWRERASAVLRQLVDSARDPALASRAREIDFAFRPAPSA